MNKYLEMRKNIVGGGVFYITVIDNIFLSKYVCVTYFHVAKNPYRA